MWDVIQQYRSEWDELLAAAPRAKVATSITIRRLRAEFLDMRCDQ